MPRDPDLSSLFITSAMDTFLSSKSFGESFEGVRELTDSVRQAKSLHLPVEAGTRVMFSGGLGAYLGYDDPPPKGASGTVISVKSATGNITAHDGRVFVEWDTGGARSVHADHLRLAPPEKKATRLRFRDKNGTPFDIGSKGSSPIGTGTVIGFVPASGKVLFGNPKGINPAHLRPDEIEVFTGHRTSKIRVSSLGDLTDFLKVANDALIHKSTRDLWSVRQDADGFVIERLFDDAGEPLKG